MSAREPGVSHGARVSVVIPHYGSPEPTQALVEQLLAQHDAAVQVIVADDHSPQPFPADGRIDVVRRDVNGGFGSNVNSGAALARHDLLLILNSDVEVDEHFIADLVAAAQPWLPAVLSPRVVDHNGAEAWTARKFPTASHQVVEWLHPLVRWRSRLHGAVGHDVKARGATSTTDWVVGAAMLLPTAEFRRIGGFDESFFMNSEEVDLQRRLREHGVPSVALASPTLAHEGGGSSPSGQARRWLVESRLRYARKWKGPRGEKSLRTALRAASAVNYVWNSGRRLAGSDVDPKATLRGELALLRSRSHEPDS